MSTDAPEFSGIDDSELRDLNRSLSRSFSEVDCRPRAESISQQLTEYSTDGMSADAPVFSGIDDSELRETFSDEMSTGAADVSEIDYGQSIASMSTEDEVEAMDWIQGNTIATSTKEKSNTSRGRRRQRVCFVLSDSDSESLDNVDIASYSRGKEKRKNARILELSAILRIRCCKSGCLHQISRSDVDVARTNFQTKSMCDQREWLLNYLWEHHNVSGGDIRFLCNIGAMQLCQHGWRLILGIERGRLWKLQKDIDAGLVMYMPPNHHRRGMRSVAVLTAMVWLSDFTNKFGEKLPVNDKIHLPSCLTRANIYGYMKEDIESEGGVVCSKSHFLRLWRKEMSHVTIPRVNRFSKCDACTELKTLLEKANDKEARKILHQKREEHLTQQMTERRKYYHHIQKARKHPDKYLSVIIDGMDQKSTSIPRFFRTSKSTSNAWKLPTHVTGTITHGRGQHLFIDTKEHAHDANLTATILLNIIYKNRTKVPDVLYLQMDNCFRENKNQTILGLCALLVEMDIFKKVKIGFLMKGHTHEDIDQLFSRISTKTRRLNIPTLSSLLHHIPKAYNKPNTTAEQIHTVYNIRDWLRPYLNKISQHSQPHQFKIICQNGRAILRTKKWSDSGEWQETTGEEHILISHPPGQPDVAPRQDMSLHIQNMRRDLPKYGIFLSREHKDEWASLMNGLEEDNDTDTHTWPLVDILMAKDAIPFPEQCRSAPIQFSNDEQDPIPPVHLGTKHKRAIPTPAIGDMIGVFLEEFRQEWPQVGKILRIEGDRLVLHWFSGTTTSKWTAISRRVRGSCEPYEGTTPSSSVITPPFKLTKCNKLPQDIQRILKEKQDFYAEWITK